MSKETLNHLNTQTLIGFTEKRGNAWHYRAEEQGAESNHYPLAIPVEDVRRRLFNFKFVEGTVESTVLTDTGVTRITDDTRKTIVRSDTLALLGLFKTGYKVHDYDEWLIENAAAIMDDSGLQIGSAGLLRNGGVAWVQYELPEAVTAAGLEFRPFLTAATSVDGTLASTYTTGSQAVVCDNTLTASLAYAAGKVKVRHSSQSLGRLGEVRDHLGLVIATGEDMAAEIERLASVKVSDKVFGKFLDDLTVAPLVDKSGKSLEGKALTFASTKRDQMTRLWKDDERAATWHGTALGAFMAHNTWQQHFQNVRNISRTERNALNVVEGKVASADTLTLAALSRLVTL